MTHHSIFCERFHTKQLIKYGTAQFQSFQTSSAKEFVTGVDFECPFERKIVERKYGKLYLVLFACAISSAKHIGLFNKIEEDIQNIRKRLHS